MRNLAAIFFFGAALVALCGSSGGAGRQVQIIAQPVRVINTPNEGPWLPVANDSNHPIYVVGQTEKAPTRPTYEYKVDTFTPPMITPDSNPSAPPALDMGKLPLDFEGFLNRHPDWEVVSVPGEFKLGPNIIAFRRLK